MFKLTDYTSEKEIINFCKKNCITKMYVFGSALTDKLGPESDIDILVEFDQNHIPGLMELAGMEIDLAKASNVSRSSVQHIHPLIATWDLEVKVRY